MAELTKTTLSSLEEEFRSYHAIPRKIRESLLAAEWKQEDINSHIQGNHKNEPALNELIKREKNKSYIYYSKMYADIGSTYDKLNDELKHIVDKYMWGEYSYLSWREIAEHECYSKNAAYDRRYKILETYAYEKGILI